jgi:hypothetical protein
MTRRTSRSAITRRIMISAAEHDRGFVLLLWPGPADPSDHLACGFPALDEAGQYERADAPPGGTVWDAARALAADSIFLPDCRQEAVLRSTSGPGASGFLLGWDADMIISGVLAVARDPGRITWDDPVAWPGTEITGQPCWRAEGIAGAVSITVAVGADGEIIDARLAERAGAVRNLWSLPAVAGQPGKDTRQLEGARS